MGARIMFWTVLAVNPASMLYSQTGELDDDGSTVASMSESEETLDRLRLDPLDLRNATLSELLEIPGITRREAVGILRAIRSGRIERIQDLVLVSGVSTATVELISPYVKLSSVIRRNLVEGFIRQTGRGLLREGEWNVGRSRHQILLLSSISGALAPSGLVNLRWSSETEPSPRVHASTILMDDRLEIHVGHLSVHTGSPLLDDVRRPGLYRPSEWNRMISTASRVRVGPDEATSVRGSTVSWRTEERRWLVGHVVDQQGDRTMLTSFSQSITADLRVTASWRSDTRGVSWGLARDDATTAWRMEFAHHPQTPISGFAFGRWSSMVGLDMQLTLRHCRGVLAGGLARQGTAEHDEDGGTVSLLARPARRWKYQATVDVSRLRSRTDVAEREWSSAHGASLLCELSLTDRDRYSFETGWNQRPSEGVQRITFHWTQKITYDLWWNMTISSRRETPRHSAARSSKMFRCDVQWKMVPGSFTVRWFRVHGSSTIQFWNVGPGPSAMGSLRPVSGQSSMLQVAAQGTVNEQLLTAVVVSHSLKGDGPEGVEEDVSASILLEIRL